MNLLANVYVDNAIGFFTFKNDDLSKCVAFEGNKKGYQNELSTPIQSQSSHALPIIFHKRQIGNIILYIHQNLPNLQTTTLQALHPWLESSFQAVAPSLKQSLDALHVIFDLGGDDLSVVLRLFQRGMAQHAADGL
jgi:hypothetical protein